jgi:hypothetical protein
VSPIDLPRAAPGEAAHEHELRLVAVAHEEGLSTSEYQCTGCGLTWFE